MLCFVEGEVGCIEVLLLLLGFSDVLDGDCVELILEDFDARDYQ